MIFSTARLPRARHLALTWGIADQHGGMTGALLRRSRSFRSIGGVDVDILTLDDRPDYAELAERMHASGALIEGLRIRNLWDELRARTPAPRGATPVTPDLLQPEQGDVVTAHGGTVLSRVRHGDDGATLAVDRFRRDGSLLATERAGDAQRIVVHDENGTPVRSWRSRGGLHHWWLDRVTAGSPSFLLVDSKTAARSVTTYRRAHVATVHIVHASHRLGGRPQTFRASRESVLRRAADFDEIVVLTDRQRLDLVDDLAAVGVTARITTVANGVELPAPSRAEARDGARGVIVASLDTRKRLGHAVDALAKAHSFDDRIQADIFGEGPREDEIRARIQALGSTDDIRLRGHDPAARSAFRTAGFSLLTSASEGLPLVLVESMAAGCLPLAYDIRYGPADMIRDGENGFLFADGDIDGLSRRIVELQSMPPARVEAMRRRAVARAAEFSDAAVTRRWSRDLRAAFDAKLLDAARDQPLSVRLRRRAGVLRRRVLWLLGR